MTRLSKLTVEHFRTRRVPNLYSGELSWGIYQTVRNAIVRACRSHGPTGPMGEFPVERKSADISDWKHGDENPVYWIVDDQYNDEMYIYGIHRPFRLHRQMVGGRDRHAAALLWMGQLVWTTCRRDIC
jgi:hypothetical protein